MHPEWRQALEPAQPSLESIRRFLDAETASGRGYLPAAAHVMRVFSRPLSEVRVLIVGQDPYPSVGHPVGLAFSVDRDVRPLPRSLRNVYRELEDDVGVSPALHGDLSAWADQGVMLLNRVLTVSPGVAGSHRGIGWESVTEVAVRALAERGGPLVALLWGADARSLAPLLNSPRDRGAAHTTTVIESVHPSPLSASRGFFGSRPFSRANAALALAGAEPVDWRIDSD